MSNELNELLNNYEKVIYGKEEISKPTIHQIHLLLDYIANLQQENQELKKQLEYLRSGEYYNQLRFENEMLQQVVDTNGVPSEVYDYIDCTHRNTELLEENQKCKEVIDKLKEFIESKNNGVCVINGKEKEAFTFLLDFDKAREFIWKLLDILNEVE